MKDLIKIIEILKPYMNDDTAVITKCYEIHFMVDSKRVSIDDITSLDLLRVYIHEDGHFYSFKFGGT